jgi:hypothetical protein
MIDSKYLHTLCCSVERSCTAWNEHFEEAMFSRDAQQNVCTAIRRILICD